MFRNLIGIIFRPNATLDRLLEERKSGQSWGVTWFLVGLNVLLMFLLGVFFAREITDLIAMTSEEVPEEYGFGLMLIFAFVGLVVTPLYYVLSRFFFTWIVQIGVRISASGQYPREAEERRERAALLRLIQPYTLWIYVLGSLLPSLFLPFVFDLTGLVEMIEMSEMSGSDTPPAEMVTWMIGLSLWSLVSQVLTFGLLVHMIIVRTMAIKKIYGISGSQAFWGPFLIYFLLYFGVFILFFVLALINAILAGGQGGAPML